MRFVAEAEKVDGRAVRRSLNQTGRYIRQVKNDEKTQTLIDDHGVGYSSSGLVAQMRESGYLWQQGELTIKLAKAYGYCWGVERAVRMAYEARNAFPDKKLYVTNEIIHNPEVNQVWRPISVRAVYQRVCVPFCTHLPLMVQQARLLVLQLQVHEQRMILYSSS